MPGAVFLEGERVNLRTVEEEDIEFVRDNFNHPDVREGLSYVYPNNLEQEEEWYENVVCEGDNTVLAICRDDEIMGVISLKPKENGETAQIGIWLGPDFHGNGYGTEASELMVDHGFKQLRFHKIYARAFEFNKGSQRIWEKLGFEKEGELKEHSYSAGEYQDVYMYGITEEEW